MKRGTNITFLLIRLLLHQNLQEQGLEKENGIRKKEYYLRTGKFESKVVLTKDFVLLDGYSTYKLAKKYGEEKIPVVFAEYIDE